MRARPFGRRLSSIESIFLQMRSLDLGGDPKTPIVASIRASAAFALAFTASCFSRVPAVEYAPSIKMSSWLARIVGLRAPIARPSLSNRFLTLEFGISRPRQDRLAEVKG